MSEERTETLEDIRAERVKKHDALVAAGVNPYPNASGRTHTIHEVRQQFASLEEEQVPITVAGRVLSIREHGAMMFIDLFDGTGTLQGFLKADNMNEAFATFQSTVDRGDFVDLTGTAFTTKRGEQSVLATEWTLLTKSLLPTPTEHFGIKDEDERYRKRYLDILLNKELAAQVRRRSTFWNAARSFLLERGYIEVETPVLETTPGGAEARPFVTHHNALDMDVHLRISAGELWQKKLMVAGLPKTFEIGRIFRNEGMSNEHLQDYTQLEFYQAYSDFNEGKKLVRDLYIFLAKTTFAKTEFTVRDHVFDLAGDWVEYDFCALLKEAYGIDPRDVSEEDAVKTLMKADSTHEDETNMSKERAVDLLWKKIRTDLSGPGFLVNVPVYLEPLAKRNAQDPRVVERFQVVLAGSEVGKGFSELNDPIDQAERFAHQEKLREAGDEEAQFADSGFVEALEYGMPPTFGFGTSERLYSFLEGIPVREGQIFPLLRPKD